MTTHKIVITGGPGTGKTSIINKLKQSGQQCYPEISRDIILEARKDGIEQLFTKDPLLFSQKLLDGRIQQYKDAENAPEKTIFLDRGIPDILAYMEFSGQKSPDAFVDACKSYRYSSIFLVPPWSEIHTTDNERYETFEQTERIHQHLKATYENLNYNCILVPFGTVAERCNFILKNSIL